MSVQQLFFFFGAALGCLLIFAWDRLETAMPAFPGGSGAESATPALLVVLVDDGPSLAALWHVTGEPSLATKRLGPYATPVAFATDDKRIYAADAESASELLAQTPWSDERIEILSTRLRPAPVPTGAEVARAEAKAAAPVPGLDLFSPQTLAQAATLADQISRGLE